MRRPQLPSPLSNGPRRPRVPLSSSAGRREVILCLACGLRNGREESVHRGGVPYRNRCGKGVAGWWSLFGRGLTSRRLDSTSCLSLLACVGGKGKGQEGLSGHGRDQAIKGGQHVLSQSHMHQHCATAVVASRRKEMIGKNGLATRSNRHTRLALLLALLLQHHTT